VLGVGVQAGVDLYFQALFPATHTRMIRRPRQDLSKPRRQLLGCAVQLARPSGLAHGCESGHRSANQGPEK
jgi:hypothetical protein